MLSSSFSGASGVRTTFSIGQHGEVANGLVAHETPAMLRARLCPTRYLTVDDLLRLLSCIDGEGGMATLDNICDALPDVARPVSGVLDLCDAGLLEGNFSGPLDGAVQVWRAGR